MRAGIAITNADHMRQEVTTLAGTCNDHVTRRRLQAIAMVTEGADTQCDRSRLVGVTRRSLLNLVFRHNVEGPDCLKDSLRSGRVPTLDGARWAVVRSLLEQGSTVTVSAWTLALLKGRIEGSFGTTLSLETVRWIVRSLGFRKVSARPSHPKADRHRQEEFRSGFSILEAFFLLEAWFRRRSISGFRTRSASAERG